MNPILRSGLVLTLQICGLCHVLYGGSADSTGYRRFTVLPVPGFGYTPETRTYVAAISLFTFRLTPDTNTRPGNAKAEINLTQRRQLILEAGWNFFSPGERHFSSGRWHYSIFPDNYWRYYPENGRGHFSDSLTIYQSRRMLADAQFLWRFSIKGKWFAGPAIRYLRFSDLRFLSGSADAYAPLAHTEYLSPLGLTVLRDKRDNQLLAQKGDYFATGIHYMMGASGSYPRIQTDLRKYFSNRRHALALRLKSLLSPGPSLDMALLGGDDVARGYYLGRYRGPWLAGLQAEWRYTFYRRWGMAAFGGLSTIQLAETGTRLWLPNAGAGLRFRIDRRENINLRLDYAIGAYGNTGFYVAFGESF